MGILAVVNNWFAEHKIFCCFLGNCKCLLILYVLLLSNLCFVYVESLMEIPFRSIWSTFLLNTTFEVLAIGARVRMYACANGNKTKFMISRQHHYRLFGFFFIAFREYLCRAIMTNAFMQICLYVLEIQRSLLHPWLGNHCDSLTYDKQFMFGSRFMPWNVFTVLVTSKSQGSQPILKTWAPSAWFTLE